MASNYSYSRISIILGEEYCRSHIEYFILKIKTTIQPPHDFSFIFHGRPIEIIEFLRVFFLFLLVYETHITDN